MPQPERSASPQSVPSSPDPPRSSSTGTERSVPGERFPRSVRLKSRVDFDELFQNGHVVVDRVLVVHARTAKARGRIGISISKRVGNAPCRNRWKRLIREAYRRLAARSPAVRSIDFIVRPRRGAVPDYAAIERSLASLSSRLDRQLRRPNRD